MHIFLMKYEWFEKLQKAAVNPVFMLWNLEEVTVNPFALFCNHKFMVLNFQEAAVKPFAKFYTETLIVHNKFMIFRSWHVRVFARLCRPVPVCGGPYGDPNMKPLQLRG